MNAYAQKGDEKGADDAYKRMLAANIKPIWTTFTTMMNAFGSKGNIRSAEAWFHRMSATPGIDVDIVSYSCMISACANARKPSKAKEWYDKIQAAGLIPDISACCAVMKSYCIVGDVTAADEWLEYVAAQGLPIDDVMYGTAIRSCAESGNISKAEGYLARMDEAGIAASYFTYAQLVNVAAHAGLVAKAQQYAERVREIADMSVIVYNALLRACRYARPMDKASAEYFFTEMVYAGIEPDITTLDELKRALGKNEAEELCRKLDVDPLAFANRMPTDVRSDFLELRSSAKDRLKANRGGSR
ncbi:unnamed protein product [Polarella glacialis]|uniref:Pentacotripeptide-repeat region of PRORP domain-containing protein n=1 Tax=Polarella glacialis TaxID=89957 RepID=A0A813I8Y8_POLGL|nr:unnamed protein product [Polarella glacialis]